MIKVAKSKNNYDLSKQIESVVTQLQKSLLKLEVELNKKGKQINQYDKILRMAK